ncbi:MAG: PIN domain-containing protein [Candidatus ainarchaeum sp.]|nr:PIN domain-containing protein [Candidatus ainarchaeum sp.]
MLLDTFAWIEFFNATEKGARVNEILHSNPCFTSAICLAEISEWIEKESLEIEKIMLFVKSFSTIIGLDYSTLELAGILKLKKRKISKNFGMVDAIILATAKQHCLKIVTGDKHFEGENAIIL